ncbi:MAG: HTH-type transcriptional regulator CysB [Gammaproteobacteria bacterium]|nr:HTH-type transcriptional regulator CysB [Gammaproteobacteria bacterium]
MTLQQLKYLVAIADNGLNITAAADRLYTSQPGISKQLKLLEQELGVQLFTRKGKSLSAITPAGREVIARARRIMREAENIRNLASDLSGEQEGTLSIATTHTQARHVLPRIIKEFRDRYPKVNLELHQGTSEQIAELVAANRVDFAIATGSRQLFPGLVLLPCFRWDRVILVPNRHPLTAVKTLSLPLLATYPLVTYVFGTTGESSLKKAFAEHGLEPNVVFTARDADIIKTYVRMGMGVGIVAPMAYECQDQKDLTALSAAEFFPRVTTWLGFRRDSVLRRYVVDFIALFAPHLTPHLTRKAAQLSTQAEVDELFDEDTLPLLSGCKEAEAA